MVLLVLSLAARGVASPLLHLHDGIAPTAEHTCEAADQNLEYWHTAETAEPVRDGHDEHQHPGGKTDPHPLAAKKICDANSGCCGSLAVVCMDIASEQRAALGGAVVVRAIAGLGPVSLDRPPSPRLA
jgi:hypothetical protein